VPQFQPLGNPLPQSGRVEQLAFSPDGKQLVAGVWDGQVHAWDHQRGQLLVSWQAHRTGITGLVFSPDGKTLYTSGPMDRQALAWDTATWQQRTTFPLPMQWVTCLAVSPNGRWLAVGGGSFRKPGQVCLFEAGTGEERTRFSVRTNTVSSVGFLQNGRRLAAGSRAAISPFARERNGRTHVWDIATEEELPWPPP
jgi:WD40 repeat protein